MFACIGALAACSGDGSSTAGNTEFSVIVPNNESAPGVPAPIDIQSVEYTINCLGNDDTFLDNNDSFPDEVVLNGNLEVVDGRTSGSPPVPTEIWQGFMDLPPGPCTVQLRARDGDGEVICTATEPFSIAADTTTKVNMVLICDVSYQAPVGMFDVDATFSFNVGNFCPDLFVLNCLDSAPAEQDIGVGIQVAITTCEVRFRDGDSSCGNNCDPQTCTPTPEGLTCTPGPDPGVSTTVTCVDAQIDCDGNPGTTETSCTFAGDTTGTIGGTEGTFNVACIPLALGGIPGGVATCTAVTADGDVDCDKTKTVSITCPGIPACEIGATPPPPNCDDGNDCTANLCDDATGTALCVYVPVPAGTACFPPGAGIGWCDGAGFCQDPGCVVDEDCDTDGNECTVAPPGACDVGTGGTCSGPPVVDAPDGTSCAGGGGFCQAGACLNGCLGVFCDDGNECTQDLCDDSSGVAVCVNPNEPDGTSCNAGAGQCASGICNSGDRFFFAFEFIDVCCNTNANPQHSIIPARLEVYLGPVVAGGAFTATLSGFWTFPESLLDTAQAVVPAGVQETDLQALQATVVVRAGATGPPVAVPAILPASTCLIGATACDKGNDVPGNGNTDCLPQGNFNPCQSLLTVPTSTDPGVCASLDPPGCTLGVDCTKTDQFDLNGFCVTGPLPIPLETVAGNYTAGASGETILFGWDDVNTSATFDGTFWTVPTPLFANPLGPNGLKVNVPGLGIAIECVMGVEIGDLATDPVTCGASPDSLLIGSGVNGSAVWTIP